jgi:hypothetical protein
MLAGCIKLRPLGLVAALVCLHLSVRARSQDASYLGANSSYLPNVVLQPNVPQSLSSAQAPSPQS